MLNLVLPLGKSKPVTNENASIRYGALSAIGAYASWGLLPIYWKQLSGVAPLVILSHRMFWSFVSILALLVLKKSVRSLSLKNYNKRTLSIYFASGLLISANWFVYIWAVNTNHVLQASLGYFLNPLLNVLIGRFFFQEPLTKLQKISVLIASVGVFYLLTHIQEGLWVSFILAFSFSIYGILRRKAPLVSTEGMYLETLFMAPIGLGYLLLSSQTSVADFSNLALSTQTFLVFSGAVTAIPLLFFSEAAKRLTLSSLGMFQYLSPSLQFSLAVFLYKESFTTSHLISFGFIWFALILYSVPSFLKARAL